MAAAGQARERARPPARAFAIQRRANGTTGLVEIDVLATEAGIHPELVRRLVRLGALGATGDRFPRDSAARLARIVRLRRDLGLNYAGAVLAIELLARIDELQVRLRRYER